MLLRIFKLKSTMILMT